MNRTGRKQFTYGQGLVLARGGGRGQWLAASGQRCGSPVPHCGEGSVRASESTSDRDGGGHVVEGRPRPARAELPDAEQPTEAYKSADTKS